MMNYLIVLNFVLLAGLLAYVMITELSEKKAFVVNEELFRGFKGKQELEVKLGGVQKKHKAWLDSVALLIEKGNRGDLLETYQENAENFRLQEQELSDKYTADIWKRINHYLSEFGKENGYEFIFGASGDGSLMYASDSKNVTGEVVEYINQKYDAGD